MPKTFVVPEHPDESTVHWIILETVDKYGEPINPRLFSEGVAPNYKCLCKMAELYLGDVEEVSRLSQEAVLRVWRRLGNNLGSVPPHVLVRGAAEWIACDWRRRLHLRQRRLYSIRPVEADPATMNLEVEYVERMDRQRLLDAMRAEMTVEERGILNLYLAGRESLPAIAKRHGKTKGTVWEMFSRRGEYAKATMARAEAKCKRVVARR